MKGLKSFSLGRRRYAGEVGRLDISEANVLHCVRNTGDTRMTFYFIKMMGKHAS
jgi:hypothetical protein